VYDGVFFTDNAFVDPEEHELHRQAIFSTSMKPHHDHYKITASCKYHLLLLISCLW